MRPQASSRPPGLKVRRDFEAHRLAADCQARAYEQVVPMEGGSDSALVGSNQVEDARVESPSLRAKGVAA